MDVNQIKALAGWIEAVEVACVEYGVALPPNVPIRVGVSDGHGGYDGALVEAVHEDEGEWHFDSRVPE